MASQGAALVVCNPGAIVREGSRTRLRNFSRSGGPTEGVKVGDQLLARSGGQQTQVWVRELGQEFAIVDGNHPLAGQSLTFDPEILSIEPQE